MFFAGVFLLVISVHVYAQKEEEKTGEEKSKRGFKKENLFAGGTVALGFGSGTTLFGVGPFFGYSVNKYLDVALSLNYNYISQRDYYTTAKYRQSIIGPGAFVRIFPVKFLFAQAQYEQNYIQQKVIYGGNIPDAKYRVNAPSLLIGPGFASGREEGTTSFYYISVLFDVIKNINSPYVDNQGRLNPVIRAGVNIGLFQGGNGDEDRYRSRNRF